MSEVKAINVLSLFDGMSCGRVALERANIPVTNYYAVEVDKYAIQITQKNYPGTIQLGDVENWKNWDVDWSTIDLLIGGSPCQGFSLAGKQLAFNDPRSKLFFVYVDILNHIRKFNPEVKFLLENVKMKKEYLGVISDFLGVQPVLINSALVSAQNRNRYYWANWGFGQPEDKNITCKDIINYSDKSVNSLGWKVWWIKNSEFQLKKRYSCILNKSVKSICQTARQMASWNGCLVEHDDGIRFASPIECERLQTLPDNYTHGGSNSQRYKMLGNGWTADVVAHIFKEGNLCTKQTKNG
jgi:site-specific DNA-cytosine methylase